MNDSETTVNIAQCSNPASGNRRLLDALLPEAFREEGLNLEAVKRSLGEAFIIEGGERYRLEWAGKSDAHKVLQTSTTATLRPQCKQTRARTALRETRISATCSSARTTACRNVNSGDTH